MKLVRHSALKHCLNFYSNVGGGEGLGWRAGYCEDAWCVFSEDLLYF